MDNRYKIVIIDDEEIVLDSCTQILQGYDYHVATATDGTTGLTLVREIRPDLVFVDLKMPGISGFEVLDQVRASDPTIVTVVITGYATVSSAVDAMKKGAYDFLPKPFTPEEFRLITQRGLEKRRLVLETIALKREKEMLRDNFAAIVSHELKAPLSAIQQNLFVLAQELSATLPEGQRNRLERMKLRLDELLKLIQTWLRLSSADIAIIQASFRPVSVASVLWKAIESVQQHATRKNIHIRATVEEQLRPVSGDEGTLTEAFVNIIGNAIKYSYPNSSVSVEARAQDDRILTAVADTGVGIASEDLPFVFEDFYRGKAGPAGEQGSGLGLAITRRIIEAHGGSVTVESELGRGSTFLVALPAAAGLPAEPGADSAVPAHCQEGGLL